MKKLTGEEIRAWITVLGVIGAIIMWMVSIYGLPPRVDKLETRVDMHEKQLATQGVKVDIILDDVKSIKTILLNEGKNGRN